MFMCIPNHRRMMMMVGEKSSRIVLKFYLDEKMDNDDDDDSSSSSSCSDDQSIEIETPDVIPNETPEDYYHRTREFWLGQARKELKITDVNDDSVRVQHLAQQISKRVFQS